MTVNATDRMRRSPRHLDATRAIWEPATSGGGDPGAIGGFLSRGVEIFSNESEAFMFACILRYSSTPRGTTGPQNSTASEVAAGLMVTDA